MPESVLDILINARPAGRELTKFERRLVRTAEIAGNQTRKIGRRFKNVTSNIFSLKTAIAGLGVGLIARDFLQTSIAMEKAEISLRAVTGSVQAASEELRSIRDFAVNLPLTTEEVVKSFTLLKSVGVDAAQEVTSTLSNVAIGMQRNLFDVSQAFISLETETLRRLGVTLERSGETATIATGKIRVEADNTTEGIRAGLLKVFEDSFPDATKITQDSFVTAAAVMSSEWAEFQDAVLAGGLKDFFTAAIQEVSAFAAAMRETGETASIAEDISNAIETMIRNIALGSAVIIDKVGPAVSFVFDLILTAVNKFLSLPPALQVLGVVGFLMFGPAGLAVIGLTLAAIGKIEEALTGIVETAEETGETTAFSVLAQKALDAGAAVNGAFDAAGEAVGINGLFTPDKDVQDSAFNQVTDFFKRVEAKREEFAKFRAQKDKPAPINVPILPSKDQKKFDDVISSIEKDVLAAQERLANAQNFGTGTRGEEVANTLLDLKNKLLAKNIELTDERVAKLQTMAEALVDSEANLEALKEEADLRQELLQIQGDSIASIEDEISSQNLLISTLGLGRVEREKLIAVEERVLELQRQGVDVTPELRNQIASLTDEMIENQETIDNYVQPLNDFRDRFEVTFADIVGVGAQAFDSLTDEIVEFVDGGEFQLSNFVETARKQLLKLAVQQALTQSLFGTGGSSGTDGGGTGGGLVGSLGSLAGSFFGASGGGTTATAQFGADFRVKGNGGADSQLVQFRATPGEEVLVRTPNQQMQEQGTRQPINVNMTVNATDAGSFRDSQNQIGLTTGQAIQLAMTRNG